MLRPKPFVNALVLVLLLTLAMSAAVMAQQQPTVVRLGLLAAADSPAGRGAQMAIAEINGAGGVTGPSGEAVVFELLSVPVSTADEVRAGLAALAERDVLALLGPDDSAVVQGAFSDLVGFGKPVLTAATGDSITISDTSDLIFRSRAPEQTYVRAVADYLVTMLSEPVVVIVQGDSSSLAGDSVAAFTAALGNHSVFPLSILEVTSDADLAAAQATLSNLNPDVVAMWGPSETAAALLGNLRNAGWQGAYFYRHAADPAFRQAVLDANGATVNQQIVGVANWIPGVRSTASDAFLRRYVTTFNAVPDALSASTYDAVYLLATALRQAPPSPQGVRQALQSIPEQIGVQGNFNPARFLIGETTNSAVIFDLNAYAVPRVQSRFVNGQLIANGGGEDAGQPLATSQPQEPPTPVPTATPEGVWGIVNSAKLNVRSGPGTNYEVIGQLDGNDTVFPVGANQDFTWLVVPFRGTTGWVATYLVDLSGDRNILPFISPPPTPTIAITPTPTLVPIPDLVVQSAMLQPMTPVSGQPFTVRVIVRNIGSVPSADTAIAAGFQPGDVYAAAPIPALGPGQAVEILLNVTVNGVGTFTVQLVTDLNNLVNEGQTGEANNQYPITYTVVSP